MTTQTNKYLVSWPCDPEEYEGQTDPHMVQCDTLSEAQRLLKIYTASRPEIIYRILCQTVEITTTEKVLSEKFISDSTMIA